MTERQPFIAMSFVIPTRRLFMPLPASPTILLAAASIALIFGRSFQFRFKGICAFYFLSAVLLAVYCLSTESIVSSVPIEGSLVRMVWKNDALAVCQQWLVLIFGLLTVKTRR